MLELLPSLGLHPSFGATLQFWGCTPVLGLISSLRLLPTFGAALQFLGLLPSLGLPQGQPGGAPCWAQLPEAFFVLLGGSSKVLGFIFPGRFWIRGEGKKKSKNVGEGRAVRGAWAEQRHGRRKGVDFGVKTPDY